MGQRLQRKARRNITRAKRQKQTIQLLNSQPVIKRVDLEAAKAEFGKSESKAKPKAKAEVAEKAEEAKAAAPAEVAEEVPAKETTKEIKAEAKEQKPKAAAKKDTTKAKSETKKPASKKDTAKADKK